MQTRNFIINRNIFYCAFSSNIYEYPNININTINQLKNHRLICIFSLFHTLSAEKSFVTLLNHNETIYFRIFCFEFVYFNIVNRNLHHYNANLKAKFLLFLVIIYNIFFICSQSSIV